MVSRLFGGAVDAVARILPFPQGEAYFWRRAGLATAYFFSVIVLAETTVGLIAGNWSRHDLLSAAKFIALVIPGYVAGFFVAGWIWDATRRVQHRLIGYITRGALGIAALYAAIGVIMPYTAPSMTYANIWGLPLIMGTVGGIAGGMMWIIDRARGRLARSYRDSD
jgi:hypothetical protein